MPSANQRPGPGQRIPLPVERVQSTIPKADFNPAHQAEASRTWVYPSEQMFYNAMKRKGWQPKEEDMARRYLPDCVNGYGRNVPDCVNGDRQDLPDYVNGDRRDLPDYVKGDRRDLPDYVNGDRRNLPDDTNAKTERHGPGALRGARARCASVVAIHNTVNEECWRQILAYEQLHSEGENPRQADLILWEAQGLLPEGARYVRVDVNVFAASADHAHGNEEGLSVALLWYKLPFDRHDWVVDRCGTEVRYVIDFYNGEHGCLRSRLETFPS
eukprot:gene12683-14992_t